MTGWQAHAACRGMDTALWYPGPTDVPNEALAICAGCPVRADCLTHALARPEPHGIWGGVNERRRRTERARLRRARVREDFSTSVA